MSVAAEVVKLNLGARNRPIPGFLSMDCDPHQGIDIVGDVADLSRFADGSVSEIFASHILEHFPHPRTAAVLKEWARVLKPSGILYVAVPDFARAVELYKQAGSLTPWLKNFLWGDQGYPTAYHYTGFDESLLRAMLHEAGFLDVIRVEQFPIHAERDCSTNVSTWDLKPVSLNLMGYK